MTGLIQKMYMPGSEWLYLKLYTGHKSADSLLVTKVKVLVEELMKKNLVKKYFFIRYSDPDFHLRIRLYIENVLDYGAIFKEIHSFLNEDLNNGLIYKIMCDTYCRETERYGTSTMQLSEDFFHVDSDAILNMLDLLSQEPESDTQRWLLSLNLIDDTLSACGMETADKLKFISRQSANFKMEHGFISAGQINHVYQGQLDHKYRSFRKEIENTLLNREKTGNKYRNILDLRQGRLAVILGEIKKIREQEGTAQAMEVHLAGLIHMTMNRLFRAKNRLYELVIYDFLTRHYKSVLARTQTK